MEFQGFQWVPWLQYWSNRGELISLNVGFSGCVLGHQLLFLHLKALGGTNWLVTRVITLSCHSCCLGQRNWREGETSLLWKCTSVKHWAALRNCTGAKVVAHQMEQVRKSSWDFRWTSWLSQLSSVLVLYGHSWLCAYLHFHSWSRGWIVSLITVPLEQPAACRWRYPPVYKKLFAPWCVSWLVFKRSYLHFVFLISAQDE